MPATLRPSLHRLDEDAVLRAILEGTAAETGKGFFKALVTSLSKTLETDGAWVTEYLSESRRLRALAFWMDGQWVEDYEFDITGTPCETVIDGARFVHFPDRLVELYPDDEDLQRAGCVSYMGVPLVDADGRILGHMAVVDRRPMPEEPRGLAVFQIFAARAAAELRRIRAENEVREREEKLSRLIQSAMDAVVEMDHRGRVTMVNSAAEKTFGCPADKIVGRDFCCFLDDEGRAKLCGLLDKLAGHPTGERYLWIPGGLTAVAACGKRFPAEATLSRYEMRRRTFHALILRNVHDRLEAERKIRSLAEEAAYLREELKALHGFDEIVGRSDPLVRVLRDVEQVAGTDASVLVLGETGTGKELVARAIHSRSRRKDRPLVKVNCAAISASLIESEFFGHEEGAFTGATRKRHGRFALADGGTIFLDEVGELPVDLQAKLLRVIQDGEFEPVGSSHTVKVDVRVLAATNRDLERAAREGRFRADLYYRLSVFPIEVPPLRERGRDVVLLAEAFTRRFAREMGRSLAPLSDEDVRRLLAYPWPGNVRELENVIERAVITSRDGRLDLARALPAGAAPPDPPSPLDPSPPDPTGAALPKKVLTARQLEALERDNLCAALEAAGWRVAGQGGAADLLGISPSTLNSRMKALGIGRPSRTT